jgi:polyphosphate glucokinase
MRKKTLVVDIGGTHVKLMVNPGDHREFDSGPKMRPKELVAQIKANVRSWKFATISIGFPAPIRRGKIARDPKHLGPGWAGFDFR